MRTQSVIVACILAIGCSDGGQVLKRGPYVQLGTVDSISVIWQTHWDTDGVLEYGLSETLGTRVLTNQVGTTHAVSIAGLQSNTHYYYRVFDGDVPLNAVARFHTNHGPADTTFDFLVFGDSGSGDSDMYLVADLVNDSSACLGVHTGDVIYPAGRKSFTIRTSFIPMAGFFPRTFYI